MQFSMQSFCGLAVLLMALGGGMALQAPVQIFVGLAVCMLGIALYMQWQMLQEVQTMAYNSSCVKADACQMLQKVATELKVCLYDIWVCIYVVCR